MIPANLTSNDRLEAIMKIRITRPTVITVDDGTRSFVAGLECEVTEVVAQKILDRRSGVVVETTVDTGGKPESPVTPRRRKATDAQT